MKERSLDNILIVARPFYTKDFYKEENNNNDAFGHFDTIEQDKNICPIIEKIKWLKAHPGIADCEELVYIGDKVELLPGIIGSDGLCVGETD